MIKHLCVNYASVLEVELALESRLRTAPPRSEGRQARPLRGTLRGPWRGTGDERD
jgi:hypothetical protein